MSEKCFCHLNGYKVKDADARAQLSAHDVAIKGLSEGITELSEKVESGGGGGGKIYKHMLNINGGLFLIIYNSDSELITNQNIIYKVKSGLYLTIAYDYIDDNYGNCAHGVVFCEFEIDGTDFYLLFRGVARDDDDEVINFYLDLEQTNSDTNITSIIDICEEV